MKKLLFTLATLLMAGTAMADSYLYIDDFEIAQDQIGTEIALPVKAHFDWRVSAWELNVSYPEGLTPTFAEPGADMTIQYKNARGRDANYEVSFTYQELDHYVAASMVSGYWQDPNGEDPEAWVTYGAVKWEAGDYDEIFILYVQADETFKGGKIVMTTNPSSGRDTRGGTVKEGGEENVPFVKETVVTVEGAGPVEPQTLAGEIVIGEPTEDGYVAITYTGDEDVTIKVMIDGIYVPMTDGMVFLGAYGESEITVEVSAEGYETLTATKVVTWAEPALLDLTGQIVVSEPTEDGIVTVTYTGNEDVTITVNGETYEGGDIQLVEGTNELVVVVEAAGYNPMQEIFSIEWTAPVVLEDLEGQVIVSEPDENGFVTVTYTGNEDVTIYVNGEPYEDGVQLNDGENTLVITVEAAGYNTLTETVVVTWTAPEPPYETPAPEVTVDVQETQVVITATGEGEVVLYVNGQPVENPYTIARTEEVQFVTVYATAQRDADAIAGISESMYVEIPELEGVTPQDPHMTGYWLVEVNAEGEKIYTELIVGQNGDYVNVDDVTYPEFYEVASFYFLINGEAYGANEDMTEAFLGDADQNPLTPGENRYFVGVGYSYTFGVHLIFDQNTMEFMGYSAYVAKGGPVDVDEINAGKAVAGVRYFNMAGQEMQEANGMTIVVTTYTDGTTSAVKVMK